MCRCTALASPPVKGGGCGDRNRHSVPVGGTWMPSTSMMFTGSSTPAAVLVWSTMAASWGRRGGGWIARLLRLVEYVPGCRRTAPASLPAVGRGCGVRNRPSVATRSARQWIPRPVHPHLVMAAARRPTAILPVLRIPACGRSEPLATLVISCGGALTLVGIFGPTRGWAAAASDIIFALLLRFALALLRLRRRLGYRATVHGERRRHVSLYVGIVVQNVNGIGRGAAPGAASTH